MNIDTDQALLESLNVSQHIWNCFEKYMNHYSEQSMTVYRPNTVISKMSPSFFIKMAQPMIYAFLTKDDQISLEVKCKTIMMTADMSLGVWDMEINEMKSALRRPDIEKKLIEKIIVGCEKNVIFFIEEAQKICDTFQSPQSKAKFKP